MAGSAEVRAAVEAAVIDEYLRAGVTAFRAGTVVDAFAGKAGRTSLFRWIQQYVASGKAGIAFADAIRAGVKARGSTGHARRASVVKEAGTVVPAPLTMTDVAGAPPLEMIARLQSCMLAADQVMAHARTEEGKVRNAKLLLASTMTMRACIETAARMAGEMRRIQDLDRFHETVISAIARCAPAVAEEILGELRGVMAEYRP